jgi:hypothetical protein
MKKDFQEKAEDMAKALRFNAVKHYSAALKVDQNRLVGFYDCLSLAQEIEHEYKLVTQLEVKL